MPNATIKDIATELGLSRNTVSKVINGKGGVLADTARRIIETAIRLGYTKISLDAKRLAGIADTAVDEHRGYIAVVSSESDNYFWMGIINGVSRTLTDRGYSLLYVNLTYEQIQRGVLPTNVMQDSVDGIIVANLYHREMLEAISRRPIPKVYFDMPVDAEIETLGGDVILSEGRTPVRRIVRLLASRGKKRLGFIGDTRTALSIAERWQGFREGLEENGLDLLPEYCFTEDRILHFYSDKTVVNLLRRIETPPDAFVCANDSIAMRVVKFYADAGAAIPDRIAVTGFDCIAEGLLVEPHLTSVYVDNEAIGRRLARQLLWRLGSGDSALETIRVHAGIVEREST